MGEHQSFRMFLVKKTAFLLVKFIFCVVIFVRIVYNILDLIFLWTVPNIKKYTILADGLFNFFDFVWIWFL